MSIITELMRCKEVYDEQPLILSTAIGILVKLNASFTDVRCALRLKYYLRVSFCW